MQAKASAKWPTYKKEIDTVIHSYNIKQAYRQLTLLIYTLSGTLSRRVAIKAY